MTARRNHVLRYMPMANGNAVGYPACRSGADSSVERESTMAGVGKCFLLTGPPGVGKTTLIMRIFESLKLSNPNLKLQGFYTQEIRQGGERIGFEVFTLDGRRGQLACTVIPSPEAHRLPRVGKYKVDVASFESVALPELKIREDTDLFIIDEVGKMELYSSYFFPAILKILQSNIPLLATVPISNFGKDIPAVARLKNHPGAIIFTLDQCNRDAMQEQIYSQLVDVLPKPKLQD
ncbi:uncharacterized protein LOC110429343 isoform X1 [Herrania umbratica]|uniref:Uncharacterized protein LOC110429343 isoform X1 n=1 Tax=Herrania umbratica TaxID=108875 RepID=A0A6J1BPM2_9ROSI|nr:uncharacterized protein LOC110429343 isoform X1 [Herrania umbratica]